MGHLAQSHGTRQTGTALQGVHRAQHFAAGGQIVRVCGPLPQGRSKLGQQLQRFFFKNRKEIHVQQIDGVDVVIPLVKHQRRHCCIEDVGQRRGCRCLCRIVSGISVNIPIIKRAILPLQVIFETLRNRGELGLQDVLKRLEQRRVRFF